MSKIALEGNASGTGTFTIASPNSNSNYTLTLPSSTGTVVVTGGAQTIEFAAGSAASPSITFTGDTNTGIFSPAADTIAFTEGGAESMRIDSSGNVGIGTSSPAAFGSDTVLVIYNASTPRIKLQNSTTGTANTDGAELNMSSSDFIIENREAGNVRFFNNSAERMRIDSSGNVGIGTTSPGYKLDVSASSGNGIRYTATSTSATIYMGDSSGTPFLSTGTNSALAFGIQNTERARITSGGAFVVGGTATVSGYSSIKSSIQGGSLECSNVFTISSSVDTTVADCQGAILVLRDASYGGTALVIYENGVTPTIISSIGVTAFVTAAPTATQIQVKNKGGNQGVALLGGSSRNNTVVRVGVFMCQ